MYALGACLYTLLFGRIPFSAPNLYKLFQVVQNDPVRYPDDVPISDALREIMGQMLIKVRGRGMGSGVGWTEQDACIREQGRGMGVGARAF